VSDVFSAVISWYPLHLHIYAGYSEYPRKFKIKLSGMQELRRVLPGAMIEKTHLSQSVILTIKGTLKL
jgi:hypothetical protein